MAQRFLSSLDLSLSSLSCGWRSAAGRDMARAGRQRSGRGAQRERSSRGAAWIWAGRRKTQRPAGSAAWPAGDGRGSSWLVSSRTSAAALQLLRGHGLLLPPPQRITRGRRWLGAIRTTVVDPSVGSWNTSRGRHLVRRRQRSLSAINRAHVGCRSWRGNIKTTVVCGLYVSSLD
ncbi:hypothetical protein SEVIR_8G037151v4 [Setaria viridis]